jgi:hypothetical protein
MLQLFSANLRGKKIHSLNTTVRVTLSIGWNFYLITKCPLSQLWQNTSLKHVNVTTATAGLDLFQVVSCLQIIRPQYLVKSNETVILLVTHFLKGLSTASVLAFLRNCLSKDSRPERHKRSILGVVIRIKRDLKVGILSCEDEYQGLVICTVNTTQLVWYYLIIQDTWHVSTKRSSSGVLHRVGNYRVAFS